MLVTDEQDERARQHLDWKAILYAGLVIGVLFLFVPRGSPYSSLGLPTHVMGRPLFAEAVAGTYWIVGLLQMILALCYTFIVAAVVYRLRAIPAIFTGGIVGLALYGLNYLVFHYLLRGIPAATEFAVALTHVAFCMIAAGAYKGLSVPKVHEPQQTPRI